MKMQVRIVTIVTLLVLVLAVQAIGQAPFVSTFTAQDPVIDGNLDDVWSKSVVHEIPSPGEGLSGTIRSLWTKDALFLFMAVKGPGVILTDGNLEKPWRGSSIELSLGNTFWKAYTLVSGGKQVRWIDSGDTSQDVIQGFMKPVDGGWVAEIKVTAHSEGTLKNFVPAEGATGFSISIRANVMIDGQTRVYFDMVKDLSPNDALTFPALVFRK